MPPLFNFSRYGGCNFEQKVAAATAANYSAAIVFNLNSDRLLPMGGDGNDTVAPSVFIGYSDAADIMEKYLEPKSRVRRNVFAFEKKWLWGVFLSRGVSLSNDDSCSLFLKDFFSSY